jgi:hypothetical protein
MGAQFKVVFLEPLNNKVIEKINEEIDLEK